MEIFTNRKSKKVFGGIHYIRDLDTNKIWKVYSMDNLFKEIEKLSIINYKYSSKIEYKEQFKPKKKVIIKKYNFCLRDACPPEREFKKGKGMVLTEKGKKQMNSYYYLKEVRTSRGNIRKVRRSHGLHLKSISTLDYNLMPKDENGKRIKRKIRYIKPPKSNLLKEKIRREASIEKNKYREHKKILRFHQNRKRRRKRDYHIPNKIKTRTISKYKNNRRIEIRKKWEEKELRLVKYQTGRKYNKYHSYLKYQALRNYYYHCKMRRFQEKLKEQQKK